MTAPPTPQIAELCEVLGEEGARELVNLFLAGFAQTMHDLQQGDPQRARRAAHNLKSTCQQMGLLDLAERCAVLEERLARPAETVGPADVAAITADFSKLAGALRAFGAG